GWRQREPLHKPRCGSGGPGRAPGEPAAATVRRRHNGSHYHTRPLPGNLRCQFGSDERSDLSQIQFSPRSAKMRSSSTVENPGTAAGISTVALCEKVLDSSPWSWETTSCCALPATPTTAGVSPGKSLRVRSSCSSDTRRSGVTRCRCPKGPGKDLLVGPAPMP